MNHTTSSSRSVENREFGRARRVAKAVLLAATSVALTIASATASAGKTHTFTEYVRVVKVEPLYRDVTVSEPQRICRPVRHRDNHHRHRHHRYGHDHQRDSHYQRYPEPQRINGSNQRYRSRSGEVFVGGVIGGAIGRELSRSVNGRPTASATIAGAVIGSAIANSAGNYNDRKHRQRYQHSAQNHRTSVSHRGSSQYDYRDNYHNTHNRHAHNRHDRQQCTTTTQTRTERRPDGYRVTYRYRGHRYQTRTRHHPGDRLAVTVTVKPQRH